MMHQQTTALPAAGGNDARAATFEERTKDFAEAVSVAQRMANATQCQICHATSNEKPLGDVCKTGGHLLCGGCFAQLRMSQRNPANLALFAPRGQGKCPSCNEHGTMLEEWTPNVALNRVCREISDQTSIAGIAAGARQAAENQQNMAAALFFLNQAVGPSAGATEVLLPLLQRLQVQGAAQGPARAAAPAAAPRPAPVAMHVEPVDEAGDGVEDEDEDEDEPAVQRPEAQEEVQPRRRGRPRGANAQHPITARAAGYRDRRSIVSRVSYGRFKEWRRRIEARLGDKLPWPCTNAKYLGYAEDLMNRGRTAAEIWTAVLLMRSLA